ncbi:MAG TPA: universal stress protein [Jatrophihabitans sp.]|nr:universal stress protein [Jatrophihabitans sp.]
MPDRRPIVVGVDELGADQKALRWAVDRAVAAGTGLRLVHAFHTADARGWTPRLRAYPLGTAEQDRAAAEGLVAAAEARSRAIAPGVEVETVAVEEPAVDALLAEAESASLLVLGSRELGRVASFTLGSVSQAVAERASCPVAVIRRDPARRHASKVVVGLDLDHDSDRLLDFSFELGDQCDLPVEAVTCWRPPIPNALELVTQYLDEDRARVEADLNDRIARWKEKYPRVQATTLVSSSWPVPGLVALAGDLNPLVLGRRGRHPTVSALRSVHVSALHEAKGPVIIVPTGPNS